MSISPEFLLTCMRSKKLMALIWQMKITYFTIYSTELCTTSLASFLLLLHCLLLDWHYCMHKVDVRVLSIVLYIVIIINNHALLYIYVICICRLGHGEIEDEHRSFPLRVETFLMLK